MYPPEFNYVKPNTLEEAIDALSNEGAVALAGGQSLIPLLKLRVVSPTVVVDINKLPFRYVKYGEEVEIGALVRHYELEESPCGLLSQTARNIGDVQIRSMGTVGGSLAYADPRGDWPTAMLAGGAVVKTAAGWREIEIDQLYRGPYVTSLNRGEIITSVKLRCPPKFSYVKFSLRRGDFPIASVAAAAWVKDNHFDYVRIAASGAAEMPVRLKKVEAILQGAPLNRDVFIEAAETAKKEAAPPHDFRTSAQYRKALIAVAVRRALEKL